MKGLFHKASYIVLLIMIIIGTSSGQKLKALVFSKTTGFTHTNIQAGLTAIQQMALERNWVVDYTVVGTDFTAANLPQYDVVVFHNTCELIGAPKLLDATQQTAFENYIKGGGAFAGIHCAAAAGHDWPWYAGLVGATVDAHPAGTPQATLTVENKCHPSTEHLGSKWTRSDEWYDFMDLNGPRKKVNVLLSIDESTYTPRPGKEMPDHPMAWYHYYEGSRSWFTAGGHTDAAYLEPEFITHVAQGIEWAAGVTGSSGLILEEFDGGSTNGQWSRMLPGSADFQYQISLDSLVMLDQADVNQHIVRDGILIESGRPYVVETTFKTRSPLHGGCCNSFSYNLNVAGPEGDYGQVNTWSINQDIKGTGGPGGVMKHMGFVNGGFREIGQTLTTWGAADTEYRLRVYVNADLNGQKVDKQISVQAMQGHNIVEEFTVDYSSFGYQPNGQVRFGLNTHGANWVVRNLVARYTDVSSGGGYVPPWTGPAPSTGDFERVTVTDQLHLPMEFEEGPGGIIYVIQQTGELMTVNIQSGATQNIGKLSPVHHKNEHGGLGLALDPDFVNNQYLYIFYTPTTIETRISRFTLTNGNLDLTSEKVLITFPVKEAGHMAGSMSFGPDGMLYIATGADDGPGQPENPLKTAACTNDLRGKVLRIKPELDGTASVPSGNLFTTTPTTRGEIYSMGHRNPFRMSVDPKNGWLFVGEVGGSWEELNLVKTPANFGWPIYEGNRGNNMGGPATNNTCGEPTLPEAQPVWLTYSTANPFTPLPNLFGGLKNSGMSALLSGPVFYYDLYNTDNGSLPSYYHGRLFWYDYSKGQVFSVKYDNTGVIQEVREEFQSLGFNFNNVGYDAGTDSVVQRGGPVESGLIEMEIGRDGHAYFAEYWSGRIYKVNYTGASSKQRGLWAHWKLDDGTGAVALDEKNNYEGTIEGTAVWSTGKDGGALTFDGVDDVIKFDPITLTEDFAISAWVNLTSPIHNEDVLVGQAGVGNDINFFAGLMRVYTGSDVVIATTALTANTWTHVAISRTNGTVKLYINGIEDASATWTGTFTINSIGQGNAGFLQGQLDDVAIYSNISLNGTQIQAIANGGALPVDRPKYKTKKLKLLVAGNESLQFSLEGAEFQPRIHFKIYNMRGSVVGNASGTKSGDKWIGIWNPERLHPGMYWVMVTVNGRRVSKKTILGL